MGGAFKPIELAVNPTVSLLIKSSQTNRRKESRISSRTPGTRWRLQLGVNRFQQCHLRSPTTSTSGRDGATLPYFPSDLRVAVAQGDLCRALGRTPFLPKKSPDISKGHCIQYATGWGRRLSAPSKFFSELNRRRAISLR
jgi:hypothetical protein